MTCVMIVKMKARAGERDDVVRFFREMFKETRVFPGCEAVELYTVEGSPDDVVIIDRWTDRSDFDRYFAWRAETGHIEQLTHMLAQPIELMQLHQTDC